jgi:hypothetical protein
MYRDNFTFTFYWDYKLRAGLNKDRIENIESNSSTIVTCVFVAREGFYRVCLAMSVSSGSTILSFMRQWGIQQEKEWN